VNLSLFDVGASQSYPLVMEQIIRQDAQESAPKAVVAKNNKKGRPKGSKNKNREAVKLSAFQTQLQGCIRQALNLIGDTVPLKYFVYDGALGNTGGVQMVRQTGLHVISKLRHDSELYLPFSGEQKSRGKPRKYGDRLTLDKLTEAHFRKEEIEDGIKTRIYQVQVWHKKFPELLNVVIIVKTNLSTGKTAKALLFSNDLTLTYDKLKAYYQLRFQIEFNFRDAKQHWGLEDFMTVKETKVRNAANFSMFMVTLSKLLAPEIKGLKVDSMLDLKAIFRTRKYAVLIIKSLGIKSEQFLMDDLIFQASQFGRIHQAVS
jgi:putative transposase